MITKTAAELEAMSLTDILGIAGNAGVFANTMVTTAVVVGLTPEAAFIATALIVGANIANDHVLNDKALIPFTDFIERFTVICRKSYEEAYLEVSRYHKEMQQQSGQPNARHS